MNLDFWLSVKRLFLAMSLTPHSITHWFFNPPIFHWQHCYLLLVPVKSFVEYYPWSYLPWEDITPVPYNELILIKNHHFTFNNLPVQHQVMIWTGKTLLATFLRHFIFSSNWIWEACSTNALNSWSMQWLGSQ